VLEGDGELTSDASSFIDRETKVVAWSCGFYALKGI
jgi:hypothetical protein